MAREPIDTGTTGSSSSADTVNNFALKCENNFDDIYSAYSDNRLDDDAMIFHASGYYQYKDYSYWADSDPVAGGQYIISTYGSSDDSVAITLPNIISTYSTLTSATQDGNYIRQGELIRFMVLDDSLNTVPISLTLGDSDSMADDQDTTISCSAGIIELVVESGGWNYYIKTFTPDADNNGFFAHDSMTNGSKTEVELYDVDDFDVFKFTLLIKDYSSSEGSYTNFITGEFDVMVDGSDNLLYNDHNEILSSDLYDISLRYYEGSVYIDITPNDSGTTSYYTIKGTSYIKLRKSEQREIQSTLNVTYTNSDS